MFAKNAVILLSAFGIFGILDQCKRPVIFFRRVWATWILMPIAQPLWVKLSMRPWNSPLRWLFWQIFAPWWINFHLDDHKTSAKTERCMHTFSIGRSAAMLAYARDAPGSTECTSCFCTFLDRKCMEMSRCQLWKEFGVTSVTSKSKDFVSERKIATNHASTIDIGCQHIPYAPCMEYMVTWIPSIYPQC